MCLSCHNCGTPSVHDRASQHLSGGKEIRIRSWSVSTLAVSELPGTLSTVQNHSTKTVQCWHQSYAKGLPGV